MHSDGKVTIFWEFSHGQGHDTAFCQIAADVLGLEINDIELSGDRTGCHLQWHGVLALHQWEVQQ